MLVSEQAVDESGVAEEELVLDCVVFCGFCNKSPGTTSPAAVYQCPAFGTNAVPSVQRKANGVVGASSESESCTFRYSRQRKHRVGNCCAQK